MKVFIRTSSLNEKSPQVIATYDNSSTIKSDAHGPDMTVLELPDAIHLIGIGLAEGAPRLPDDWRERFSEPILEAEARRRIEEALPISEQLSTLRETVELILHHGQDVSTWPKEAKDRKADIDDAWNYVRDLRARVRALKSLPANPVSDKNWPTKIAKAK